MAEIEYVRFSADHLDGILHFSLAEAWPTLAADRERALRVLTAPGSVVLVALDAGVVVGFARALTDGAISCYLAELAVASDQRGRGIGRGLVEETFRLSGAKRVDLLAEGDSEGFYQSFYHRRLAGYRIYPHTERYPYVEEGR